MQIDMIFLKIFLLLIASEASWTKPLEELLNSKPTTFETLDSFEQYSSHNPTIHNDPQSEPPQNLVNRIYSMETSSEFFTLTREEDNCLNRGQIPVHYGGTGLLDHISTAISSDNDKADLVNLGIHSMTNYIERNNNSLKYTQCHTPDDLNLESTEAQKRDNFPNSTLMTYNRFDLNEDARQPLREMVTGDHYGGTQSNWSQQVLLASQYPFLPRNHVTGPICSSFPPFPETNPLQYCNLQPLDFKLNGSVSNGILDKNRYLVHSCSQIPFLPPEKKSKPSK